MDPRIEKVLKLPLYQRLIILGVICAGIIAAVVFLVYLPQIEEHKKLEQQNETLAAQLVKDRRIADNLPRFKQEYEKMQQQLTEALKELPNKKEIPALLTSLASLAKDSRLEVLTFKPGKEVPREFYADVPVALRLQGGYHDVAEFFEAVGDLSRIVNISNLRMKVANTKDGRNELSVDCTATTFRFLDNPNPVNDQKRNRR